MPWPTDALLAPHVLWPADNPCIFHGVVHPENWFAYEGCRSNGSGVVGPVCGLVAQGKVLLVGFGDLGFFDLGRSRPWREAS